MYRVPRAPAAVVRVGIPNHSCGHPQLVQRGVHLLCLFNWHSRIGFAVDEQRGRLRIGDVFDRRLLAQNLVRRRIPGRTHELALLRARNVGRAVVADPVGNARARNGRCEPRRVRDHPVGQEPAVRVTGDAHPLLVDVVLRLRVVDAGHHVLEIEVPPAAPRRPQECLAVVGRSARIRVEDQISVRGEQLVLERKVVPVRPMRPAVHRQDQRPRARGIAAVDHQAVGASLHGDAQLGQLLGDRADPVALPGPQLDGVTDLRGPIGEGSRQEGAGVLRTLPQLGLGPGGGVAEPWQHRIGQRRLPA